MKICNVSDCIESAICRGMCNRHYIRWRKYGDPNTEIKKEYKHLSTHERFLAQVVVSDNGYWTWNGCLNRGYGRILVNGKRTGAHQYVYEYYVGPIPEGYEVDHCCRIASCVDIRCLDAVTHDENMRRRALSAEEHWALRPDRERIDVLN